MSSYLLIVVWLGTSLATAAGFRPEESLQWWEYESDGEVYNRVLLEIPVLEYGSEDDDSTWFSPHELRTNTYLLDFLAQKGCDYLSGFVHTQIEHQPHTHHARIYRSSACDWTHWATKQCRMFHVNPEMCSALMACNATKTLWALNAPDVMYQPCNISYDTVPAVVGKRQLSSITHSEEQANTGSSNSYDSVESTSEHLAARHSENHADGHHNADHDRFPPHSVSHHKGQYPDWFQHLVMNMHSISPQLETLVTQVFESYYKTEYGKNVKLHDNSPNVDRFCHYFSRHLQTVYHFERLPRSTWSQNWITDVYKLSARAKMPPHLAHGLVGCGMTYARDTMDLKPMFNYFLSRYQR